MKISEMIDRLEKIKKQHGDLKIVGGYVSDDIPPRELTVVNTDGCDHAVYGGDIEGVFIQ